MKYILPIYILFVFVACRSTKPTTTTAPAKDTVAVVKPKVDSAAIDSARLVTEKLSKIKQQQIDFSTFSARVKMDYEGNDKKLNDITAFIRIKKDSAIWVSLNAVLGIEAVRVLITPDSVKVLDKLNKTIQYKDFKFLQDVTKLPVDFATLQNLIVGNPVFMNGKPNKVNQSDLLIQLVTLGEAFQNNSDFDQKELLLNRTRLQYLDTLDPRSANLEYGGYELQGEKKFSTKRKVNVVDKKSMNVDLDFKQVTFNSSLNFPFAIPGNYKLK